ncbi:MAG: hypothetical protein CMH41_00190 [Micrococcales bacterium]|nr:hypothetical protein [Micrococcales bacterium]
MGTARKISGSRAVSAAAGSSDGKVDPRGPRFSAAITSVVLAAALISIPGDSSASLLVPIVLLAFQAMVFGAAALFGLQAQLYGRVFRTLVVPRLGPPAEWEEEAPPRFSQLVGLVFVLVALVGLGFGLMWVAQIAVGFALTAALLNAVFNYCLGCEMYLLAARLRIRT